MLWKLNFIIIWVSNSITEFCAEEEDKNILRKWQHTTNQERQLALEMSTSRTAHTERERERAPAKQHQGKAWATKGQQNLLVNMVINRWLIACKASWDKLYNYVKSALRVSPYFQVLDFSKTFSNLTIMILAIFKSLQLKVVN
jgi:hypothetical protein